MMLGTKTRVLTLVIEAPKGGITRTDMPALQKTLTETLALAGLVLTELHLEKDYNSETD